MSTQMMVPICADQLSIAHAIIHGLHTAMSRTDTAEPHLPIRITLPEDGIGTVPSHLHQQFAHMSTQMMVPICVDHTSIAHAIIHLLHIVMRIMGTVELLLLTKSTPLANTTINPPVLLRVLAHMSTQMMVPICADQLSIAHAIIHGLHTAMSRTDTAETHLPIRITLPEDGIGTVLNHLHQQLAHMSTQMMVPICVDHTSIAIVIIHGLHIVMRIMDTVELLLLTRTTQLVSMTTREKSSQSVQSLTQKTEPKCADSNGRDADAHIRHHHTAMRLTDTVDLLMITRSTPPVSSTGESHGAQALKIMIMNSSIDQSISN